MRLVIKAAAYICLGTLAFATAAAQEDAIPSLEAFGALAVGEWTAANSRHVLEWGVGRQVIHSKSYFGSGEDWVLVAEGFWYQDPSGSGVRGVSVAIEMPVNLFEYHSEVEGDSIVHRLVSYGEMGGEYRETWQFDGEGYRWTPGAGRRRSVAAGHGRRLQESRVKRATEARRLWRAGRPSHFHQAR